MGNSYWVHFYAPFLLLKMEIFLFGICSGANIPASFVFGDSLVDVGNNNYLHSFSQANIVPNGIDFPPYGQPTGRYTNGRTIVDVVGQELGLPDFTPPYLAPTTVGEVILRGVNYASGGGGILNATGKLFIERLNFDAQIDCYANTRNDIMNMIGASEATKLANNALFSVTMGSNDLINNYFSPISAIERLVVSPEMFVDSMIAKFRVQLTRLYDLDARKIVVANIGPIGCIPFQRDSNPLLGENCVPLPNQMAASFNQKLRDLVEELNTKLYGATFVYADVFHIVVDIIQNYRNYGFQTSTCACCYVAGKHGGMFPCGPPSKVCPDRSKFVFWDPYHPSDAANVLIANRLIDGDTNDVYPMNIRKLLQTASN